MEEERTIFEQLLTENETGELMSFILRLAKDDKRSFLVYGQMVRDMVRHKQEEGSSATDVYCERKNADLRLEIERLRAELEALRSKKDEEISRLRQKEEQGC